MKNYERTMLPKVKGISAQGRRLDSIHDLSKGERDGLKQHGIKPEEFDKMDTASQYEWKEEMNKDAYQKMRKSKI